VSTDPFLTDELRGAALQAWRSSPTRFREDANAEEDLVLGGYRDRWFVELAQNAADAAARAGVPGELRVELHGRELRVANTGAPLDAAGVTALASLRASAKREAGSVGRFGIGFAAVLPISAEPRVVSASGGVAFSASRTRELVDAEPTLRDEVSHRGGQVPVLRLGWPTGADEVPPDGFDTEVRLPLLPDVDGPALLDDAARQASDLLLALPALRGIDLAGRRYSRSSSSSSASSSAAVLSTPSGVTRWLLVRRHGELPPDLLTAAEERHRPHWSVCWAVPVSDDGVPEPVVDDVLHAPTPTDERLSLPARLLAGLPIEPSRRRLQPGPAARYVLDQAVRAYPDLVRAVASEHRTALVPAAGFPRSDVDSTLRDGVVEALRDTAWLPAAVGPRPDPGAGAVGAAGPVVAAGPPELSPVKACVLDAVAPRLVELIADLVPGLLAAELSAPAAAPALVVLDVPRLGLAEVVAATTGVLRPPTWWRDLYEALTPIVDVDPGARAELAALPVPLADGRTVTGPRTTVVLDLPSVPAGLSGLRIVHPDAMHPLLTRLGAEPSGPRELLDGAELRESIERSIEDADAGLDVTPLIGTVLALVASSSVTADEAPWLGALAMPAADGEIRRADELVLPDGALRAVLAEDSPLGILRGDIADAWPRAALRAVGVLDGFAVIVDDAPTGPDHDLDDEDSWWDTLDAPPARLLAVRDLDLVADTAWPQALRLLAASSDTGRALRDPYTRWWLARHARLAGHPPRHWRLGSAVELAGLYDPVPLDLDDALLIAAGVRTSLTCLVGAAGPSGVAGSAGPAGFPGSMGFAGSAGLPGFAGSAGQDDFAGPAGLPGSAGQGDFVRAAGAAGVDTMDADDAVDLLVRLADPDRSPAPATVRAAHAALAGAYADDLFDLDDLDLPSTVRAVSGEVCPAADAYVLDRPWLWGVADPDLAVAGGDPAALAELLDLPLASDVLTGEIVSDGHPVPWSSLPEVAAACETLGRAVPPGSVVVHSALRVRSDGVEYTVPWWVDRGVLHAADPVRAILFTPVP